MDPFAGIIGHVQICELLRRVSVHPGNAYLFFGANGVGKKLVAERFAAALLNHPIDRTLEAHPDFVRLMRETDAREIVVKQARELIQRVSLSSGSGGRTVVLIEEADALNEEAANSLLKIIEEPGSRTTYLLLAERAERLPATLRSRMALIPFERVALTTISTWLVSLGATEAQSHEAAEWSQGCPGIAKKLLEGRKEWEGERARAKRFVETLTDASLGKKLAIIEEVAQSLDRSDESEQGWRTFLQLCMQAHAALFAKDPKQSAQVATGLIHAWRLVGSSLSPRFALEWCTVGTTLPSRSLPSFLHSTVL